MRKKITTLITGIFLLLTLNLFSQEFTVKGKVSDSSGELLGVSVLIKGTNNGTSTDFDGNYSIKAKKGDKVIFSYIGYKSKEVIVKNSLLDVVLEEDSSELDEIVVTAFGIKKEERSLGYSVQQVKSEDIELKGQTSAISALQGRIAGVQISQSSEHQVVV